MFDLIEILKPPCCRRCTVPFPASSEYELSLQPGDVVTLVKRREDGWCKGTHHR